MVSLIYSSDLGLIQEQLSSLMKNKSDFKVEYLFGTDGLKALVNDLKQVSLFSEPKIYVLKEATWFTSLEAFKNHQELLNSLLEHESEIIMVLNESKLSSAGMIQDYLKRIQVFALKALTAWNITTYINDLAKKMNLKLTRDQVQQIASKLVPEAAVIQNELSKLQNYKKIDRSLIENVICNYDEANLFKLVEYWLTRQTDKLLVLYDQFIQAKYDPTTLITLLTAQIYRLYLLKQADTDPYLDQEEIKKLFNLTAYSYKANMELISHRDLNQLKYTLSTLYQLDLQIKLNLVDKIWGLKLMLLKN